MTFIRKVETWITNSKQTEDGWSQIKPFIFLKSTNSDGFEAVSYTHLTLPTTTSV